MNDLQRVARDQQKARAVFAVGICLTVTFLWSFHYETVSEFRVAALSVSVVDAVWAILWILSQISCKNSANRPNPQGDCPFLAGITRYVMPFVVCFVSWGSFTMINLFPTREKLQDPFFQALSLQYLGVCCVTLHLLCFRLNAPAEVPVASAVDDAELAELR